VAVQLSLTPIEDFKGEEPLKRKMTLNAPYRDTRYEAINASFIKALKAVDLTEGGGALAHSRLVDAIWKVADEVSFKSDRDPGDPRREYAGALKEKIELVRPADAPGAGGTAAGAAAQQQAMLIDGDDEVPADDQDEDERPGDYDSGWRGKAPWEQVARAKKEHTAASNAYQRARSMRARTATRRALKQELIKKTKGELRRARRWYNSRVRYEMKLASSLKIGKRMEWAFGTQLSKMRSETERFCEGITLTTKTSEAKTTVDVKQATALFKERFTETRPSAPATDKLNRWRKYFPRERNKGAGRKIGDEIKWWQVYLVLFPANKMLLHYIKPCQPECRLCKEYIDQLTNYEHGRPDKPPPCWKPCVKTGRAAGPDGITASLIRFTRNEDPFKRYRDRRLVSEKCAELFNLWLKEGKVRDTKDFRLSFITPLLKTDKAGNPLDASQPGNYRGIAVSNFLPNLFSSVILSKMSHWAVKEGIISGEQIGFMPKLGCEMHVLSAIQTVKMNASQGRYTAITFIDFSSAYDNVNLELLWEMLREAGVAENVITVLEDWYATRQYQVRAGD
jgi:Reverse transcriptase (RNA-dependent DNA polymerase)